MKFLFKDNYREIYQCHKEDLSKLYYSEINRKPDIIRVSEIKQVLEKLGPNIILPSCMLEGYKIAGRIYLLDGFHRFTAMKEFGKNITFLLSIINSKIDKVQEFNRINKSVPVSDLYTEESPKKKVYEDVVAWFQFKYSKFFTSAKSPRQPNTNKDIFLQLLYESDTDLSFSEIINELLKLMEKRKYKKDETKIDHKMIRCLSKDFWLFWAEPHEIKQVLKPKNLINLN